MNNHTRNHYLKTILVLHYAWPFCSTVHYKKIKTAAAKSNTISDKNQSKRQAKQISLKCFIYFKSGIRDIIQNIKAPISYL